MDERGGEGIPSLLLDRQTAQSDHLRCQYDVLQRGSSVHGRSASGICDDEEEQGEEDESEGGRNSVRTRRSEEQRRGGNGSTCEVSRG